MDALQFTASIVGSLAWPTVAIVAIVLLRRPLAGLLPLLRHLKYRDLELDFSQEVQQLKQQAEQTLKAAPEALPQPSAQERAVLDLAVVSPRAAIVDSWRSIESAIRRGIEARGFPVKSNRDLVGPRLIQTMGLAEILDGATRDLIDRMRMLRNEAAHAEDFEIDEYSARAYAELAAGLVREIDAAVAS